MVHNKNGQGTRNFVHSVVSLNLSARHAHARTEGPNYVARNYARSHVETYANRSLREMKRNWGIPIVIRLANVTKYIPIEIIQITLIIPEVRASWK